MHPTQRTFVRQGIRQRIVGLGITEHLHEIAHCLVPLHLAFGQVVHAVHELVPLRDGDTQLLLHGLGVETGAMRHLDRPGSTIDRDGQGVVAHHSHGGWCCRGGQGAVAGSGQQQVAIDQVVALQRGVLPGARQRPELAAAFEHTRGFQLVARDLGEIAVELQDFPWLHHLVALGDHRERCLGIGAVEHLLFGEGVDATQMTDRVRLEVDGAFLDLPVHAGLALPDFQRLFRGKAAAQTMPGGFADIGHAFDEMSHDEFSCEQ
ncbi:hypothetical protein FG99_15640 [Pseudomonas sp. AAC]|nr:hypothetical protein FG99_15640 [Pseudomonas sp. AAC]